MADKSSPENNNDEIDLVDLIGALWDGKWIILGVTALVTLLGAAYVFATPRTTTASLTVQVSNDGQVAVDEFNREQRALELPEITIARLAEKAVQFASLAEWSAGLSLLSTKMHDSQNKFTATFDVSERFTQEAEQVLPIIRQIEKDAIDALFRDIEDAAKAQLDSQIVDIEGRIDFLQNQLEIAKAVGQTHSVFQGKDGQVVAFLSTEGLPHYHYGSIAIETEIKQLQRKLQTSMPELSVERLENVDFLVPTTSDFTLSISSMSYRTLLLAFLAGGFLSLVVLVVWRSLNAYWQRKLKA